MAGNRQASAAATELVARLVNANVPIAGEDAVLLQEACRKVSTVGVRFGAHKAALVNVSSLLRGFTGHLTATTKTELADEIVNFITLQVDGVQPPPAGQALRAVEVGSPEWTRNLIAQIKGALAPEPVAVPGRQRPERWSDTDSEGPGFFSVLTQWYNDEFEGEEDDVLPLLVEEKARISEEPFKMAFIVDAAAVAECRKQLPTILQRKGAVPTDWSPRKIWKLWLRAVSKKIIEIRSRVQRRSRLAVTPSREAVSPSTPTENTPTVAELPESRRPKKFYGETQHDRFQYFQEQYRFHKEDVNAPVICDKLCEWAQADLAPPGVDIARLSTKFWAKSEADHCKKRMALLQEDFGEVLRLRCKRSTNQARADIRTEGRLLAAEARQEHAKRMYGYVEAYERDCDLAGRLFVQIRLVCQGSKSWAAYYNELRGHGTLGVTGFTDPDVPVKTRRRALEAADAAAVAGSTTGNSASAVNKKDTRQDNKGSKRNARGLRCDWCNSRYHLYADCTQGGSQPHPDAKRARRQIQVTRRGDERRARFHDDDHDDDEYQGRRGGNRRGRGRGKGRGKGRQGRGRHTRDARNNRYQWDNDDGNDDGRRRRH